MGIMGKIIFFIIKIYAQLIWILLKTKQKHLDQNGFEKQIQSSVSKPLTGIVLCTNTTNWT